MSADDDRKAGAIAGALALGTHDGTPGANAQAISVGVARALNHRLASMAPDHIAGAATFFRELSDALDEHSAKLMGTT